MGKEQFHEELYIKPFPNGDVLTHFQFTTLWSVDIRDKSSCKYLNLHSVNYSKNLASRQKMSSCQIHDQSVQNMFKQ